MDAEPVDSGLFDGAGAVDGVDDDDEGCGVDDDGIF